MAARGCLLGLLGCLAVARASIIIDGFSAVTNDRFANDGLFILSGADLSGVGMTAGGQWGTLISANVIVSAAHWPPGVGSTLVFYASNDASGGSVVRTVVASQQLGTSDVWLGVLNEPVPDGYAIYAYATAEITDSASFVASGYAGATAYMLGRSQTVDSAYGGGATTDAAVGANVLDLYWTDYTAIGAVQDQSGDSNYLTYEAYLQVGDSGGPLFTMSDSTLELVGINWFIIPQADVDPGEDEVLRNISGFSYLGNHGAEIQAFLDAHPVPEPSALVLVLAPLVLLAACRRR